MPNSPAPEAVGAVPPTVVSGAMLFGVELSTWVQIGTLIYVAGGLIISLPRILRALDDLRSMWRNRGE